MKLAEALTVLYWVFGVVWCREFSVTLPDRVEAVRGLCVLVPCAFEIGSGYEEKFKRNLKGLWRKDGPEDSHTVFDSTTPETNQIKGEIRGDLRMKNCTTLFYSVRTADSGRYYFRIEGEDKMTFKESSVDISVSDPKPTLSVYVGQTEVEDRKVLEGSSVSLICSALAPCPSNPPTLTWSPLPLNSIQEQNQTTSFISSHLSFTASHLHHRLRINCSATYRLENYTSRRAQRGVVLHVEYPPRNTTVSVSPSGPVLLGGSVSLSCSSDGNPAVLNYTWYRENGEQIETGDTLTITETDDTHSGLYYCRAENQHGTQNSSVQLDVQYAPQVSFSSHCNGSSEGGIECVCEVHGFPVPKLEWRLSGQSVPPPANSSIREEHLGNTGMRSFISLRQSPTDTPTLQCIGSNHLGSTAQLFHSVAPGSCSPTVGPFHVFSVLVGAAIGAFAVMLLCTVYVFRRRAHHKPSNKESAGLILNERAVCQDDEEESLNCNKSSKLALSHRNPDILHYSTISFPNGEEGSGEIRGLSSLTPEYATVQHGYREQCEGETAEDVVAEDKETKAYEMVQPSEEEVTYGNIVRHKAALPDVDVSVNLEQTKPEQLTPSAEAEGLYAEVKHKPELRASKK